MNLPRSPILTQSQNNIKIRNLFFEILQLILLFDFKAQDKSKCGNKAGHTGRGDLKDCYCDLPESSDWISINSDIEQTHPRNPRTDRTTVSLASNNYT